MQQQMRKKTDVRLSAPDAERAVLGSILLDNKTLPAVESIVVRDDIYDSRHRKIYDTMLRLQSQESAIDLTTLTSALDITQDLETVGGPSYLASLEQYVVSTANVEHHARLVADRSRARKAMSVLQEGQNALVSGSLSSEVLPEVESSLFDLEPDDSRSVLSMKSIMPALLAEIDERRKSGKPLSGLSTGIPDLDMATSGFHPDEYITLAARPSVGKSALASTIGLHVGYTLKKPVLIYSVEMSKQQWLMRMLSSVTKIPQIKLRDGKFALSDQPILTHRAQELADSPIFIDDSPCITIPQIRSRAMKIKRQHPDLALIIIDYLQLITSPLTGGTKNDMVGAVSAGLRQLKRQLQVPILVLCQLSRKPEQRKGDDSKPVLSDLRDSGEIEQDSQVVLFLWKEKEKKDEDRPKPDIEIVELLVRKNRDGPLTDIDLVFFNRILKFESAVKYGDKF